MSEKNKNESQTPPLKEMLGQIPGIFGIRLEEEPTFQVIGKEQSFELRAYQRTLVAQVKISGPHDEAMKEGFTKLADYIFGDNRAEKKMEMTIPVFNQKEGNAWTMSFVMSNSFNLASVPKPKDDDIRLFYMPERKVAVLKYSGNNNEEQMQLHAEELRQSLTDAGYKILSDVRWAQYDQPWTIPIMKRNEAQFDVEISQ